MEIFPYTDRFIIEAEITLNIWVPAGKKWYLDSRESFTNDKDVNLSRGHNNSKYLYN